MTEDIRDKIVEKAQLEDDSQAPDGYKKVKGGEVYKKPGSDEIVILGEPVDVVVGGWPLHDCDRMGCSLYAHRLYTAEINHGGEAPPSLEQKTEEESG